MRKFAACERDQGFLLPPERRNRIPADDVAHVVIEAVKGYRILVSLRERGPLDYARRSEPDPDGPAPA